MNLDGEKEVLGIWVGANESSKFWLSVLNDLRNRGVENTLIFCIDGLNGFKEAIAAVYGTGILLLVMYIIASSCM